MKITTNKKEAEFQPIDITITVESLNELKELAMRFRPSNDEIRSICNAVCSAYQIMTDTHELKDGDIYNTLFNLIEKL